MIKDFIHLSDLLHKQLAGLELSPEEQQTLSDWREASEDNARLYERIRSRKFSTDDYYTYYQTGDAGKSWKKIVRTSRYRTYVFSIRRKWWGIAASLALLLGGSGIWYFGGHSFVPVHSVKEQISGEKAQVVLTLSDGRTVFLGNRQCDSTIVDEENATILYGKDSLLYESKKRNHRLVWNKINVPRGGEYRLTLSDGTRVWLNSDSRLEYPVAFAGNSREVKLLGGEAYFEVARDTASPFIVRSSAGNVRVLGTEFNVRTYTESKKTVTLVKGKVQLEYEGNVRLLAPGQQGWLDENGVQIRMVDVERETAWRNGIFDFRECPLEIILTELARWYDIQVFYQNPEVKHFHFTAWFHRNDSLQQVMDLLEKTHKLRMRLEGSTLVVTKR